MEGGAILDIFCTAVQMKEKKKRLYEEAMRSCSNQVGVQTFGMLRDSEQEQIAKLTEIESMVKNGGVTLDACRFHAAEGVDNKAFLKRLAAEHRKLGKACADDVAAIDTALSLENEAIGYFNREKERTSNPDVRDLLESLVVEERAHRTLLADLKFYYLDPEGWFLEKDRAVLDGA